METVMTEMDALRHRLDLVEERQNTEINNLKEENEDLIYDVMMLQDKVNTLQTNYTAVLGDMSIHRQVLGLHRKVEQMKVTIDNVNNQFSNKITSILKKLHTTEGRRGQEMTVATAADRTRETAMRSHTDHSNTILKATVSASRQSTREGARGSPTTLSPPSPLRQEPPTYSATFREEPEEPPDYWKSLRDKYKEHVVSRTGALHTFVKQALQAPQPHQHLDQNHDDETLKKQQWHDQNETLQKVDSQTLEKQQQQDKYHLQENDSGETDRKQIWCHQAQLHIPDDGETYKKQQWGHQDIQHIQHDIHGDAETFAKPVWSQDQRYQNNSDQTAIKQRWQQQGQACKQDDDETLKKQQWQRGFDQRDQNPEGQRLPKHPQPIHMQQRQQQLRDREDQDDHCNAADDGEYNDDDFEIKRQYRLNEGDCDLGQGKQLQLHVDVTFQMDDEETIPKQLPQLHQAQDSKYDCEKDQQCLKQCSQLENHQDQQHENQQHQDQQHQDDSEDTLLKQPEHNDEVKEDEMNGDKNQQQQKCQDQRCLDGGDDSSPKQLLQHHQHQAGVSDGGDKQPQQQDHHHHDDGDETPQKDQKEGGENVQLTKEHPTEDKQLQQQQQQSPTSPHHKHADQHTGSLWPRRNLSPDDLKALREKSKFSVRMYKTFLLEGSRPTRIKGYSNKNKSHEFFDMKSGVYNTPESGRYKFDVTMRQGRHGRLDWNVCKGFEYPGCDPSLWERKLVGKTTEAGEWKDGIVYMDCDIGVGVWLEAVQRDGGAVVLYGTTFKGIMCE